MNNNILYRISIVLVFIAGINWGIIGFFKKNIFECTIKQYSIRRLLYILIGIATLYIFISKSLWNQPEYCKTIFPSKMLTVSDPSKYTHVIKLNAKYGRKIIYWTDTDDNYGVTIGTKENTANIKLNLKKSKATLYYRKFTGDGKLGKVKVLNI